MTKIPPHRVKLRGRIWMLMSAVLSNCWGKCEPPTQRAKQIVVHESLEGIAMLTILLHEMGHACHWDLDEQAIRETAKDQAKVL